MKKLVLFAVAIVAISFASCGGNKQVDAEKEAQRIKDSIEAAAAATAANAETVVDSVAQVTDSIAETAE